MTLAAASVSRLCLNLILMLVPVKNIEFLYTYI